MYVFQKDFGFFRLMDFRKDIEVTGFTTNQIRYVFIYIYAVCMCAHSVQGMPNKNTVDIVYCFNRKYIYLISFVISPTYTSFSFDPTFNFERTEY